MSHKGNKLLNQRSTDLLPIPAGHRGFVFTHRQTPKVTEYPDIFSYHKITEIESKISNRIQEVAPDIRRKALYLLSYLCILINQTAQNP